MEKNKLNLRMIAKTCEHQFRWLSHEEKHILLKIKEGEKCNKPAMVQCTKCKRYQYSM